ncbi:MAG: hypothetical protein JJT77_00675 [Crocinitomicaceae bacterium]|nr:hypothetical protein [Crocinitomicaceae bacterium]
MGFIIVLIFSLTSCQLVLVRGFLGFNVNADILSEKEEQKLCKKRNIPNSQAFVFKDSSYYYKLDNWYKEKFEDSLRWKSDSSEYKKLREAYKDDFQPVQMRFFDPNGKEVLQLLNCHVNPFLFLNPFRAAWNIEGALDNFPPEIAGGDFSRAQDLNFLLTDLENVFSREPLADDVSIDETYVVVIIWNNILRKYSRKLIRTMRRYAKRNSDKEIVFVYVLNHNVLISEALKAVEKDEDRGY